jgi:hypothetical protein
LNNFFRASFHVKRARSLEAVNIAGTRNDEEAQNTIMTMEKDNALKRMTPSQRQHFQYPWKSGLRSVAAFPVAP